jgi:hypothetical protein
MISNFLALLILASYALDSQILVTCFPFMLSWNLLQPIIIFSKMTSLFVPPPPPRQEITSLNSEARGWEADLGVRWAEPISKRVNHLNLSRVDNKV